MTKSPVFIISGATASGKTSLSINLALELSSRNIKSEVINFDSLLFYKDLDIGTAKPSESEKKGVPHHLINICNIKEEMNANKFIELARPLIEQLHQENKVPILVGGSAFYIRALIKGMYQSTPISEKTRQKVDQTLNEKGFHFIREELKRVDLTSYEALHENDEYRNIRAYEFYIQTGSSISEEKTKIEDPYDFNDNQHPEWDIFHIYLDIPKEEHWSIIEKRTHSMIEQGLIKEVEAILADENITGREKSLQSIGYKESVEYIRRESSELQSIEALSERIYISTRQLAKAQKTFFKKIRPKHTYHPLCDKNRVIKEGLDFLSKYYPNLR